MRIARMPGCNIAEELFVIIKTYVDADIQRFIRIDYTGGNLMLFHELETERMFLKNITTEDREFCFQQFSDPDITEYL